MKPFLLILGGSIGVGKTTLAYSLAHDIPNTEIIENDTIRRELLGFSLAHFMNHELDNSFSEKNNVRTANEMNTRTKTFLAEGKNVIRTHVEVSAQDIENYTSAYSDGRLFCVYLLASENIIRERLSKRKYERDHSSVLSVAQGHASDADENVLLKFPVTTEAPNGWHTLDAMQSTETLSAQIKKLVSK